MEVAPIGIDYLAASNNGNPMDLDVVVDPPRADLVRAEHAAAEFLQALGLRLDTESLRETPRRMVAAYEELLTSRPFRMTTFPNDEGYD
jgi:GTP cyclohydrolase I